MLISLFMSIKADIKRSKEKRQRKKKRLAQERLEQNKGTASDAKTAKKPVKHSFYVINKIKAGFVGIIEAIPITVILVRLLIFVIILAMILAILASFVSTIAQAVTDITVAASEALNFSNAFEDMKSSSEMLSDGTVRTILKYNKTANPSDNNSDDTPAAPITFETNDVAFWCSLSDAQIDEYIIKAMTDAGKDINQINKTANLARLIRMAYRICYAGDEDGTHPEKRILKNIEPYTLLGIPYFEKGYSWMQAQCGSAMGGYEGSSSYDAWYHLEGDTWTKYTVSDSTAYKYMNIDDSVPEIFLNTASSVGKCAFVDGPLSLSVWASLRIEYANKRVATDLAEAFSSLKDGQALYKALAEPSDSYKAYRLDAYITKKDKSFSMKETEKTDNAGDGYALASVLPSMLLTALKFESDYVKHFNTVYEGTVDGDFRLLAAKNTSEEFEKGITDNVIEYYLTKVIDSPDGKKGSAEYNRYRRALLNILYYSYHHLPAFDYIYADNIPLGNTNQTGTANDWFKSHALVILSSLHISNGNPAVFTVGTIRNEITFTDEKFTPFNTDGVAYKYAIAGAWSADFFGGEDEPSTKTLTNIDGKATEVQEKDFKKAVSFIKQNYTGIRLYDTAKASSEYLTGTLIGYALNKDALFKNGNISYAIITAQSLPMRYGFPNLHSLCPEGLYATVVGNDIIYQFMSAFGVLSKASDDPMPGIDTKGTFWKTLGFYKGFDNQLQQGILPFKDVTDNDNLLVLGDTTSGKDVGKWELAVNEGTGYYRGTTQDHRGIDFLPFRVNGTGILYDKYALSTLSSCNALYDDIRSAFAKYGSGGKESLYKYYKDKDNSLPDKDFRIPLVSIADGYVQYISCTDREKGISGSLGCHVTVRYTVKVGKTYNEIDVTYSHMSSDLIFIWDKRLNGKIKDSGAYSWSFSEKEVKIKQGEVIGYMNTTGDSATSHLHFAMSTPSGKKETGSEGATGEICASLFGMFNDKWVDSGFYPFSDQWLESFDTATDAFSESPEYYEIPSDVFSTILLSKSRDDAIKQVKALMAQKKGSG